MHARSVFLFFGKLIYGTHFAWEAREFQDLPLLGPPGTVSCIAKHKSEYESQNEDTQPQKDAASEMLPQIRINLNTLAVLAAAV